jgi:hypothetical protein
MEPRSRMHENTQKFVGVAVDQLSKLVYAYAGTQVFAFSIEAGAGHLSPIAGSPFAAADSGQQFAVPQRTHGRLAR